MKTLFEILVSVSKAARWTSLCAGTVLMTMIMSPALIGAGMPTTGTVHNLVILCQFPDHAAGSKDVPPKEVYEARYNSVGGHPRYAPGGSVRDFFATNSYGQLTITSTIVGWVKLPNPSTYYTQKNKKGKLPNWNEFYTNALAQVDPDLDFKQFDSDNSGEVDSIQFIHSGSALYQNCALSLGARTYTSGEGTKVRYLVNLSSAWSMLGNICHEMMHQAHLPDQYDTDHSSAGIGHHCLMAFGTKGWYVLKPDYAVSPCAWCKVALGWVKPTILENYGVYTARSSAAFPDIFKITKGYEKGEYLLIENRQPLFFYNGPKLPRGGLAIWHIDETKKGNNDEGYPGQDRWPQNGRHYKIALLQADGCYHLERRKNYGDGGDYYYGGHTNSVLGQGPIDYPKTIPFPPTTDTYRNGVIRRTPNQISHISAPGPEMNFTYEDPQNPVNR
ncbi:MAG: M6 family metalloprotease domain-containing protein [Kiritimatiellae bacterium]|nr:M6 family metalloprotease domain-containing protein [Kiritimatiellia bacterium]MDD5520050.1 M6 family metalloprotease domain-containing protein [Kiritimatiellia bacterium]